MSLTYEMANDDIQKMVTDAWRNNDPTVDCKIFYESVKEEQDHGTEPFIRVWVRHTSGAQRTLAGGNGRLFARNGFVRVEVYSPITKGLQESYQLAKVVADAYEGKSSDNGVWFRRVRITEMGKDGIFNRVDVIADFDYHETK